MAAHSGTGLVGTDTADEGGVRGVVGTTLQVGATSQTHDVMTPLRSGGQHTVQSSSEAGRNESSVFMMLLRRPKCDGMLTKGIQKMWVKQRGHALQVLYLYEQLH
jgi:hypothetical protein